MWEGAADAMRPTSARWPMGLSQTSLRLSSMNAWLGVGVPSFPEWSVPTGPLVPCSAPISLSPWGGYAASSGGWILAGVLVSGEMGVVPELDRVLTRARRLV